MDRKISLGVKARGRGDVFNKNRKGERRMRVEVSGMCLVVLYRIRLAAGYGGLRNCGIGYL